MQNDQRMIELLTDMVKKLDKLDTLVECMNNMEREQRNTTTAIVTLAQMLEKAVWEPQNQMAADIADMKRRVEALEKGRE